MATSDTKYRDLLPVIVETTGATISGLLTRDDGWPADLRDEVMKR